MWIVDDYFRFHIYLGRVMYYPKAKKEIRQEYGQRWSVLARRYRRAGLSVKRYPNEPPF